MTDWPDHLDAAIAAPRFHRLLLENESVRVFETTIAPGETVPLHTHTWPALYYVLSWSDFVRRDDQGIVTLDSREIEATPQPGQALWSPPLPPHTIQNVGTSELRIVSVEIKGTGR